MSIERCENIRRAFPQRGTTRFEVSWCAVKGTDYGCGGYSDGCPPKMQKYFISDREIPIEQITFKEK